ncbi:MAG: hypothetical protein IJE15_02755 [Bacteroidaceae bacterium]|nr:hypothetical protein [Bacteroidaceae bacterium]
MIWNMFKFSPFMQIDKDYSAYQQSDYRIADGDVFAQRCNAFVFVDFVFLLRTSAILK